MWNDRAFIPQREAPEYTRSVGCIPICEMNGVEESNVAVSARMAAAREEFYDVENLEESQPLTREERDQRYREGRFAEAQDDERLPHVTLKEHMQMIREGLQALERKPPVFVDVTRSCVSDTEALLGHKPATATEVMEAQKRNQQRIAAIQRLEYGRLELPEPYRSVERNPQFATDPYQSPFRIVMPKVAPCGDMTHHYECMHHLDAEHRAVGRARQFEDILGQLEMIGRNIAHARVLLGAVATPRFIGFEDLTAMTKDLCDLKVSVRQLKLEEATR